MWERRIQPSGKGRNANSVSQIRLPVGVGGPGCGCVRLLPENAQLKRIPQLQFGQVCNQPCCRDRSDRLCRSLRVGVLGIERSQEAGIKVNPQKRSRPSAINSAFETLNTLSPKIFLIRARKSGSFGGPFTGSGTNRAITRFRLVTCTAWPSRKRRSTLGKSYLRSRTLTLFM